MLGQLLGTEQRVSSLISKMMDAVWSVELRKTLRTALSMSQEHQKRLLANYDFQERRNTGNRFEKLESEIRAVMDSHPRGSSKDLFLARLALKMIRYKVLRYEDALNRGCVGVMKDARMLGCALSDEVAASLFLQEHAERFLVRQK
jgi:ferritin-like metal-binding protein YciE